MKINKTVADRWFSRIIDPAKDCYNLRALVYNLFGVTLRPNQWSALRAMLDPKIRFIYISESRQAGKTFLIGLYQALVVIFSKQMVPAEKGRINCYVFAPKLEQAQLSFDKFSSIIHYNPGNLFEGTIVIDKADRIRFTNNVEVRAITASRNAEIEGSTVHLCVLEECFRGDTKISVTPHSKKMIKEIVENRLPLKIMSYNAKTKKIEYKKIINYFKKPLHSHKLYKIKIKTEKGMRLLECTGEHRIMTQRGLIKAKNLSDKDKILYQ